MNSADTADQMTKMTLEGIEVAAQIALKAGGATAKSLAATLYAIITDNKKIKGKTRLNALLKSGKELKVFAIHHNDLKKFCDAAKQYGVLYSVLKEKNNTDGIVDIMVRAEDASKISRIVDKFELATIDTKAIRESILAQRKSSMQDIPTLSDTEHDELVKKMMNENPSQARTEQKDTTFEQSSKTSKKEKSRKKVTKTATTSRPSVRKELTRIKADQAKKKSPVKPLVLNKKKKKAR